MGQPPLNHVDIQDYLSIVQEDHVRYEFHEGQLIRMTGGTVRHSTICNNTAFGLTSIARKKGTCVAFNSEMKIEIEVANRYVYPDAAVACPKLQESATLTGAITKPRVIVEVSSNESVNYDCGAKFRYYFSLPSLKEYFIIDQDQALVTLFRRHGDGDLSGMVSVEGLEAVIELKSIEAKPSTRRNLRWCNVSGSEAGGVVE